MLGLGILAEIHFPAKWTFTTLQKKNPSLSTEELHPSQFSARRKKCESCAC